MTSEEEMVALIKGAAQECQFDKMSIEEMKKIYSHGSALSHYRPGDEEFIRAVNRFKTEIENRQFLENNSIPTSKREKARQKIVQFLNGKTYKICFMLIYITMILIPGYYDLTAKLPPDNELKTSTGELFIGPINKNGRMTGLKTPQGEILLTCGDSPVDGNYCLSNEDEMKITGKQVSIVWFKQNAFLGIKRNRLVELVHDGKKIISRDKTKHSMYISNKHAIPFIIIGLLLMYGGDKLYRRIIIRKSMGTPLKY